MVIDRVVVAEVSDPWGRSLRPALIGLLALLVVSIQEAQGRPPASSETGLYEHGGDEVEVERRLVIKQDGRDVIIQTGPDIKEGSISFAEFGTFWDSLGQLGFWQLKDQYSGVVEMMGEMSGEIWVSFEDGGRGRTGKTVRYYVPRSCPTEFRRVYDLINRMSRFAPAAPDWRTLLRYDTAPPIEEFKGWYHSAGLRAIAAIRDSQDLDTLLTMLLADNQYSGAAITALGNIGSKRAVPALEEYIARLEAEPAPSRRYNLIGDAAKALFAVNGAQSAPTIRRLLRPPCPPRLVYALSEMLAGAGDYSGVPAVVEILNGPARGEVTWAAEALKQIGYGNQMAISALLQVAESELKADKPDDRIMNHLYMTLAKLTSQEFSYRPEDSLSVRRSDLAKWLRWWRANAVRYPVGEGGPAGGYGYIQVNSSPPGAAISLDTTSTGKTTPFLLLNVAAGEHKLRLTKERYADWTSSVTVTQERTTTVDAVLSKAFGSLRVSSTPSGASVSLDGSNSGEVTPCFLASVSTGRHSLGLTKNGLPGWDSIVMVAKDQTTTANATLKSPPDSLWITYANFSGEYWVNSTGPERAVRFSARSRFGYPLYITKVSAVFDVSRFKPWPDSSFRFKIYGGDGQTLLYGSPVLEAVPGEPRPAVVHELVTPILVDSGEFYLSVAPIDTSGLPSSLGVSSYGGWRTPRADSDKHSYTGSPGHWSPLEQDELSFAVLVRRYGAIQVNSTPSGAAVSLDTASTSRTTPFQLSGMAPGRYDLWLTKDGYADWRSRVTVAQGRTTMVDAVLSQSFGSLQVGSTPSGAAISLDGTNTWKTTPYLFTSVAAGEHRLGIRGGGCPDWDSTVAVIDGQMTAIRAMLKAPSESLWATYAKSKDGYWAMWLGPERAVRFNPRDFGFDYPLHIGTVSASFYLWRSNPWPDLRFRFKIYRGDGEALLYQSPVLKAIPGEPGPAVVHRLRTPIPVDSGEFYLSVAPVDTSGQPSSCGVSGIGEERKATAIPAPAPAGSNKRSYTGSPGHWTPVGYGEFSISVLLRR